MSERPNPRDLVRFAVDPHFDGDVYMWSDEPTSVNWTISIRSRWNGVESREISPRRDGMLLEITEYVVSKGEQSWLAPAGYVSPLSAWFVGRESLVAIEIDFGDGTSISFP